ncbi:MAG: hypothetical protein LBV74_01170 [Tannerella sp.]|jgi:hypothetical protein|nr:hypothetical protein [Tannerella sp.]
MRKAIYLPDINIDIDKYLPVMDGSTLVVCHDFYTITTKYNVVMWSRFKAEYFNYEADNIVVVGMNRIRTADVRCDLVFSYIYRMNTYKTKVVIDDRPFNGEPWRIWYHFGFLYGKFLDVDYSYPLETEWKKWFYYEINYCKLQDDNLKLYINDTYTELKKLTTSFLFSAPSDLDIEYYEDVKKIIFEKYDTPKLLVNNLLKQCNKHFITDLGYESYLTNKELVLPNFGVYRYVSEENKRRMNIYNLFTENDFKKEL